MQPKPFPCDEDWERHDKHYIDSRARRLHRQNAIERDARRRGEDPPRGAPQGKEPLEGPVNLEENMIHSSAADEIEAPVRIDDLGKETELLDFAGREDRSEADGGGLDARGIE